MSHRKTARVHASRNSAHSKHSPVAPSSWSITRQALVIQSSALELSRDPTLCQDAFLQLLKTIDPRESVFPKLDPEKIACIPADARDLFLRQYISATITDMASSAGVLFPLKASQLVSFPKQAQEKAPGTPAESPPKPHDELYARIDPALAPIESEIPCFQGAFLGILQTRLQKLLDAKGIHASDTDDEEELEALMKLVPDKIPEERMFGEVRTATGEYLRWMSGGREPAAVMVLSKIAAPLVFMWMVASGLMDDMIVSLLRGKPLMRQMDAPEPYGKVAYEPTERGNDMGLWKLEAEEE